MGALQAKENIWYVGVQDPGLRVFDIIMHSDRYFLQFLYREGH